MLDAGGMVVKVGVGWWGREGEGKGSEGRGGSKKQAD